MPELPEVEHASQQLQSWMQGQLIENAFAENGVVRIGAEVTSSSEAACLADSLDNEKIFAQHFPGTILRDVQRKGKNLFLFFEKAGNENWTLHVHLGMTGKFVLRSRGILEPYSRFRWELKNEKTIHFRDPRKFGGCTFLKSGVLPVQEKLGPDAWLTPLTANELGKRLGRVRRPVKVALMDQEIVAGLGNIQAAEALFRAGVNPQRKAHQLTFEELNSLAKGIRETLEYSLSQMPPLFTDIAYVEEPGAKNPFLVYGKAGQLCSRCHTMLASFRQVGRTTYWCPGCQR